MPLRILSAGVFIGLGALGAAPKSDRPPATSQPVFDLSGSTIVGSKHDFSQKDWSQQQLCLPCHTPHSATAPQLAPLWDRSPIARRSYKLFNGSRQLPGAASLVCLSCHDGSTAVDSYGGMSGDLFIHDVGSKRARIGANRDLSSDHPIGVPYPAFDRGFRSAVQVTADGSVVLPNGRVECLSCHDVHSQYGGEKLLVKSNHRSALCLTCHRK